MTFQGAIFDLDGTLTDSMWIWGDLVYRFLEKRGIKAPPDLQELFKNMTVESSSIYTAKHFPVGMTAEKIRAEWMHMVSHYYEKKLCLKDGAAEYLNWLKSRNVKLALATSNFRENGEAFLRNNHVYELFDVIVTSDEVGNNKEYPDIYLAAAERMNVPPKKCMVFEDILVAVRTAKQAGMWVTAVRDDASLTEWDEIRQIADRYIVSYNELRKVI